MAKPLTANPTSIKEAIKNFENKKGVVAVQAEVILSLGRNLIKKAEGLDPVAATLQQLWMSYNQLERLTGIEKLLQLRVLYLSNNRVQDWGEVDKLAALEHLEDLLLLGNPLQTEIKDKAEYRREVLRRLPKLKRLDGMPVEPEELEAAGKPAA